MTVASARGSTGIIEAMARAFSAGDGEAQRRLLREGTIKPRGLMPDCSNYTYLAEVCDADGRQTLAVYKPSAGETPLDDFPDGTLGKREVAAYLVSEALGWQVVPYTTYRDDGPLGAGSLQQFIQADLRQHYFSLMPARAADFRTMAAFDAIVNNADRKSGHCLLDRQGQIWGVDNGLTFHALPKLRTVIWEFAGEPVSDPLRSNARRLGNDILSRAGWLPALTALLSGPELKALARRALRFAEEGRYPAPSSRWAYPWPLI
ncbi:MAG TPA: SCO1664 family protein [Candidatus Dormibacteraeota bacterium]|nr:SCO1664 family protein [Candidatus Dormibacteraeota bacterium]